MRSLRHIIAFTFLCAVLAGALWMASPQPDRREPVAVSAEAQPVAVAPRQAVASTARPVTVPPPASQSPAAVSSSGQPSVVADVTMSPDALASQAARPERRTLGASAQNEFSAARIAGQSDQEPAVVRLPRQDQLRQAGSFDGDLRALPQRRPVTREREELQEPTPSPRMFVPPGAQTPPGNREELPVAMPAMNAPAPGTSIDFDGLDREFWGAGSPPDTNGDAGPTYYIQTVNTSIGIYRKSDGFREAAFTFDTFMSQGNFGNLCDTNNFGDPVVLYDSFDDRWIITDFAFGLDGGGNVVAPAYECIAASKTGDPLAGGWNFYSLQFTTGLNDYPHLAIWPDGLYMSANMFGFGAGGSFQGVKVFAFNKAQMYAGAPSAQVVSFDVGGGDFTLLPSNARLQSGTPPAGRPNLFVSTWLYLNALTVYKFHVDWNSIMLSTFTGPDVPLAATSWPNASVANAPQSGTANLIDVLQIRTMAQNQYTNIGGVESLWNTHTVRRGDTSGFAAPRWYQVTVTGGTVAASIPQAATWDPDAANVMHRFMPSLAVDRAGNMALGYSTSSSTTFPSIKYAGRLASDPVNTFGQTEQTLLAGSSSQTTSTRWGDYSAMTLDPDGCRFWYTTEYANSDQAFNKRWRTRIGAFKFAACTANTTGTLTGTVKDSSTLPLAGATVALGARTTTTNASGVYTFAGLPAGTYPRVTASLPGYAPATFTNVAVPGSGSATQNFTLAAAPTTSCFVDTTQANFQGDVATDCDLVTTPGAVQLFNLPTIDQQNTAGTTTGTGVITNTGWAAQTFTAGVSAPLVKVDFQLFCNLCTSNPNLTVSIRATSAGLPTGSDLASATIAGDSNGSTVTFAATFASPPALTSGTQYALIVRTVSSPGVGGTVGYYWIRSSPSTYAGGQRVSSADTGSTWTADVTRDYNFHTYMAVGYSAAATYVSSVKDANPAVVGGAVWGTIAWNATVPAGTTLKFQVAASTSPNGPFTFVGPDNTAATYFSSGGSLALFNGKRYLRYKVFMTSTGASTPTLNDVTVCFNNGPAAGPPLGQVDTPSQNAAGVQGAIGVTGWALDDTGITKVEIFRNCLGFEPGNCQTVLGNSVVYIGDAAFLPGARPDVAAAFPSYPNNTRAGWGYLMLTPMLPDVTNSLAYGGQGALTLYAIATDTNGNQKLLGRSSDPASPSYATPTAITMTNSTIAKPFGSIDTPGQGQTISGIVNNFGWALTPDSNTVGGEGGDIVIPTNGSTMTVFIDSLPVALVAYNQCRGTVGNPVPGGTYCNDDVANIFGNLTPQAPLTARASNPTKFRNLDVTRAAIGAYTFNTATLSNGLHTIAWSVSDSLARNEGIGSRFFIVSNGSAPSLLDTPADPVSTELQARVEGSPEPQAAPRLDTAKLHEHRPVTTGVWGRTGFDLGTPWTTMHAKDDGTFAVRLPELGRLELWLGDAVDAGYLVANDTLQPLPVGASLSGPRFGWMPPAGYIGPYHLVFVRHGERIDVTVTVIEKPRVAEDEAQIRMHVDAATQGNAAVGHLNERTVRVDGWAFDPQAAIGSGIAAVHVWATPLHGDNATPFFVGAAALDQVRPDVARAFKDAPGHAGFSLTASLKPGTYTLTAYAWNERTARWEDARSVTVTVR